MIDLAMVGYVATAFYVTVAFICFRMWCKPVDKVKLQDDSAANKSYYESYSHHVRFAFLLYYIRAERKDHETFRSAWPMIVWLFYATIEPFAAFAAQEQPFTALVYWFRWKYSECSKYPQFWSVALLIAAMTAGSLLSMYLASLPPPCEARSDCVATEARGVYTGNQHE